MTIRVVLADDHTLVRAGFRSLLDRATDVTVVGEAADGREAIAVVRSTVPDVVLMDIRMPVMDGIDATRRICAEPTLAGVRILVLTTFEEDDYVFQALHAGASGFLLKDVEPGALRDAVRTVAAGDALLAPSVTRRLISEYVDQPSRHRPIPTELDELTDREREITALVAAGLTNADIAEQLVISPATAKTHVNRAMAKVGARDRAQLVVLAYESGLVTPGHQRR